MSEVHLAIWKHSPGMMDGRATYCIARDNKDADMNGDGAAAAERNGDVIAALIRRP